MVLKVKKQGCLRFITFTGWHQILPEELFGLGLDSAEERFNFGVKKIKLDLSSKLGKGLETTMIVFNLGDVDFIYFGELFEEK